MYGVSSRDRLNTAGWPRTKLANANPAVRIGRCTLAPCLAQLDVTSAVVGVESQRVVGEVDVPLSQDQAAAALSVWRPRTWVRLSVT